MSERPKIIAIAVQTLDGFIARDNNIGPVDWNSREDRQLFARETKRAGVVVMGIHTFETLKHPLNDRLNIILTSRAHLYLSTPGVLEFKSISPETLVSELALRHFSTVFIAGGARTYTEFLKAKLIDELWLTIEPVIFGKGIAIFTETVYGTKSSLITVHQLNKDTLQLHYRLSYGN